MCWFSDRDGKWSRGDQGGRGAANETRLKQPWHT
jgi:hypothetical protein